MKHNMERSKWADKPKVDGKKREERRLYPREEEIACNSETVER